MNYLKKVDIIIFWNYIKTLQLLSIIFIYLLKVNLGIHSHDRHVCHYCSLREILGGKQHKTKRSFHKAAQNTTKQVDSVMIFCLITFHFFNSCSDSLYNQFERRRWNVSETIGIWIMNNNCYLRWDRTFVCLCLLRHIVSTITAIFLGFTHLNNNKMSARPNDN